MIIGRDPEGALPTSGARPQYSALDRSPQPLVDTESQAVSRNRMWWPVDLVRVTIVAPTWAAWLRLMGFIIVGATICYVLGL